MFEVARRHGIATEQLAGTWDTNVPYVTKFGWFDNCPHKKSVEQDKVTRSWVKSCKKS